jgi:hypothetical protein
MKYLAWYNKTTGLVDQTSYTSQDPASLFKAEDQEIIETAYLLDTATSRIVDGNVVIISTKPAPWYIWNNNANNGVGGWIDTTPLLELKIIKQNEITNYREKSLYKPISYQNSLFDADANSQRNIQAWLITINAGTNPPEGFVWRDYNNVDHPADANFIKGLNNVIVARGTQLYQTSWAKKAEVDSLTTVEQVNNYDVNMGW